MTKEEYQDFVLRYKGCGACFPMYHTLSRAEKMWFTAIQKDVADLEKENADLKEEINKIAFARGNLEEENTELKEQQFSLRNERNTFLAQNEQYEKDLIDFNENLTKAKEIIREFMKYEINEYDGSLEIHFEELKKQAEQFLKEVEK